MDNILEAYAQVPSIAQEIGYEMKTTWWGDFTVAELIDGEKGIKDTFNRAWKYWRDDKIYTTELALVLNWKSWYWSEKDSKLCKLYVELWQKLDEYIMDNKVCFVVAVNTVVIMTINIKRTTIYNV